LLDVVMDNGVRFGFSGPVKMDLTSMQRLALYSGNVIIDVPGIAEGVAINTPDAVITANTALAQIQYAADDSTVLMVERGAVNVFTENGNGREVRKNVVGNESVKIASGTSDPVVNTRRVTEPGMDLLQPADLENLRFAHYSFDNVRGNVIKNTGNIPGGDGVVSGLKDHPEFPGPRQVPGRFGRAVEFSGHGEGIIADLTEFGVDEPGSVAFWIKMDPNVVPGQFENIFSWHMYTDPEKSWHVDDEKELACRIRINHSASEGVVGAVRIEFRNKWICGTADLRDGRWHHVTAVFHRGYNGTTVRHYIDGQLARASARGETWFPRERYPEIGGGSIAVGRVYWPNRPKILAENDPVGLHGMVDELYVFNQAVLPSHVSSLYMKNTPNQVTKVSLVPIGHTPLAMLPFSFSAIR